MSKNEITSVQMMFKVKTITPERQINVAELGLSENSLPPEVKSFLKENVLPSDRLKSIHRIRRKAELDLDDFTVKDKDSKLRIMHPDDAERACNLVLKAQQAVDIEKAKLETQYFILCDEVLERIKVEFKDYDFVDKLGEAVKRHQPSWEYIDNQIQVYFSFRPCAEMSSEDPKIFKIFQEGYAQEKQTLFGTLLGQVVSRSEEILKIVFNGEELQRATLRTVEDMRAKVNRLSFLDKRLKPLAVGMKTVLNDLPEGNSNVPVKQLGQFIAMITLLSNKKRLLERLDNNEPLIFKADDTSSVVSMSSKKASASKVMGNKSKVAPRKIKGTVTKQPIKRTGVQLNFG